MATRGGTVLGLALSWVLACVTQCSSTDKGHVSTCWGESSLETKLEPWNIQIEYINWERMKLDMLKKLRLYRKLDYIYLGDKGLSINNVSLILAISDPPSSPPVSHC